MILESKYTHVLIILFYFILLLIYMYFIIGNKEYVDNEQLKTVNETNTSNYLYIYIIQKLKHRRPFAIFYRPK